MSDHLDDRLRALPHEASPGLDLWPDVERRMQQSSRSRYPGLIRSGAILTLGLVLGWWAAPGADIPPAPEQNAASALDVAIDVQRNGSSFVVSISQLQLMRSEKDSFVVAQATEAALAAITAATDQLRVLTQGAHDTPGLTRAASLARRSAARSVTQQHGNGGTL